METGNGNWKQMGTKDGHMEKQETEIKRKLEMETGNRNWKRKPETENRNGNKRCTSLVQYFLHSVLSHYSSILLSNCYGTGFMSRALSSLLCYVITAFSVIE